MIGQGVLLALVVLAQVGDGATSPDAAVTGQDAGAGDAAVPDGGAPDGAATAPAASVAPPALPAAPSLGHVAGRVLSKGSRAPIVGATLAIGEGPAGDSDTAGRFDVQAPCGRRHLLVQAPGFEPLATDVDPCGAPAAALTLRLVPDGAAASFQTVVRARSVHPGVTLTDEELTQTAGTLGDPFRALESLPGVATIAWPAPIYAVRGSNPGNTGFFLDGIRVPALFHLALGPSVIHPYFFEDLAFYPGSAPARFGRYVAGIVAADTRGAATDRVHASVDVRLFDAGALVSAPLPDDGGVTVAARYSYTGELVSLLDQNIQLAYWDYQLRVDRRVGPFQLTLLAFGSHDRLVPERDDTADELVLDFHRVSLRASVPVLSGRLQGSIALGSDHTQAPIQDVYPIEADALSVAPRLSFARAFTAADVSAGFDGEIIRYAPLIQGDPRPQDSSDLGQRRVATLLAGYASTTLRLHRRVEVTPELRLDSYRVGGAAAHDWGPRLAARVALADDTSIRVAGGRFTQLPSLPLQVPGGDGFGLRTPGLQSAWQASLAIETRHFAAVDASVTGYVQQYVLTDLRDPAPTKPDPLADDFLIARDALSYGLELMLRRPQTERLYGWLSYTLSNNLRSYGGGAYGPSDWDQRHILNLVAGYRWGRTTLGGRAHYNSGRPYVLYGDAGGATALYPRRLPAFYQLDLRVDHRVYYDAFQLDVYAEVQNVTRTRQVYGLSWTGDPDHIGQKSFSLVLPSIGLRAEF